MPRHKTTPIQIPVQTPPPASPMTEPKTDELSGLYVFGHVIDRTRRNIKTRNGSSAEIVTYTIQDNSGRRYFVDEYTPEEYYELGESVEIPVYVKTFKKNSGDVGYSFCVQQQFGPGPGRGEHF